SGSGATLGDRLRGLPASDRMAAAVAEIRETVTGMLGLGTLADPDAPLRDLGLDSLSAIELRNALTVAAGVSLPATLAFDHPTISAIARFVLARTGLAATEAAAAPPPASLPGSEIDDIDALSEEEAEAELLAELAAMR